MIREYAAYPALLEARIDARWLTLAAERAGLTSGSWLSSPDPASTSPGTLPRVATRTLGPDTGSVRAARDFTIVTLQRWGIAERSQDIAIVVSELLTNALRHAVPGSGDSRPSRLTRPTRPIRPIRLGLLQPGSCVLCAVADPSRAAPVPQTRGSFAETGRGLQIIRALSDQWGFAPSDPGKVVWAMFSRGLTLRYRTELSVVSRIWRRPIRSRLIVQAGSSPAMHEDISHAANGGFRPSTDATCLSRWAVSARASSRNTHRRASSPRR
jgi:anti-sigma regulatory factor (Ser/Thr protein kinase)